MLGFGLAMLAAMRANPGEETIPYHLLFVALTLVYGFRVWPLWPTLVVVLVVTVLTGGVMVASYESDRIDAPELAEIPLMPSLLIAMIWHARRRAAAQDAVQRMADQQQAMLDGQREFFRNTSHAIRTPVTIARGHLEVSEDVIAESQARDDVQVALRQLDRMTLLSNRLLALAQLDAGETPPARRVSFRTFVLELGNNWAAGNSRVWTISCPDDAVVAGDPEWLGLAIDALIENSVHFTAEGGHIDLAGVVSEDVCTVRVSDDGPGIAAEDLDHVFERFWHRRPPDGPMGSGLGLAIAHATAQAYLGSLRAGNSETGGAVIEFSLPRLHPP